jgi:hypothetical protein
MKKYYSLILALTILLAAAGSVVASSILNVGLGGTGWGYPGGFFYGSIPIGNGLNPIATSTNLSFATSTNTFYVNGKIGIASSTPQGVFGVSGSGFVINGQLSVYDASSTTDAAVETVNWGTGNTVDYLLNANTSFVINATSSNPNGGGGWYTLNICQDATGGRTVTFITPGQLRWSSGTTTITGTANTCQALLFHYFPMYGRYEVIASTSAAVIGL